MQEETIPVSGANLGVEDKRSTIDESAEALQKREAVFTSLLCRSSNDLYLVQRGTPGPDDWCWFKKAPDSWIQVPPPTEFDGKLDVINQQIKEAFFSRKPAELRFDEDRSPLQVVIEPVPDSEQVFVYLSSVNTNQEEPGSEAETLYYRLLELLPDAVVLSDMRGRIVYVNAAGQLLFGIGGPGDLIGQLIWNFVHPDSRAAAREQRKLLLNGQRLDLVEERLIGPDGKSRLVESSSIPVRFRGQPAVLTTIRDISKRKQIERELNESRELVYKAFHLGPAAFCVWRFKDGVLIDVNHKFEQLTEFSRDELIDSRPTETGLWTNPDQWETLLQEVSTQTSVADREVQITCKSGDKKTVIVSCQRTFIGNESCLLTVFVDISDRKQILLEVRESERRFREIADSAPVLIWTADAEGAFNFCNTHWLDFTGRTLEEETGWGWANIIHPADYEKSLMVYHSAVARREPFTIEWRMRHNDGGYRWMLGTGVPHYRPDGLFAGYFGSAVDFTDRKELELELKGAKEHAEEMARVKSAFLTNMTHEVRTPLTVILGFTSMLRQGVKEEYQRFVRVIERSGRRLLLMLDSILDLAQLEAGTIEVDRDPFNVVDVVNNTYNSMRPLVEEKGLAFLLDAPQEAVYARAGYRVLTRVLENLMDNAIKFTEKGTVELSVYRREDRVVVAIRDTGIGIESQFIPRVFDEFSQESTGLERTHQGSGLGLTVSKRLLELVDGNIQVESEKGKGSVFSVSLPEAPLSAPVV